MKVIHKYLIKTAIVSDVIFAENEEAAIERFIYLHYDEITLCETKIGRIIFTVCRLETTVYSDGDEVQAIYKNAFTLLCGEDDEASDSQG